MNDEQTTVQSDDLLARFILHKRYFREDNTIRPDAFIPHPYQDLSVTRHINLNENQLYNIGIKIAAPQNKTLHGRADILSSTVLNLNLSIKPDPVRDNPNHTNISGWPAEKSEQKSIAQQIAASGPVLTRY